MTTPYVEPTTVENYSQQALTTAIYPDRQEMGGAIYASLGLVGEVGETYDQFLTDASLDNLKGEMGDIAWYINALADELGTSLPNLDIIAMNEHTGNLSQTIYAEDALGNLVIHSGSIANKLKKALRDDKGVLTSERRGALVDLLVLVWVDWNRLVVELDDDQNPSANPAYDILEANLEKLFRRKARGTLGGDGEQR